MPKVTVTPIRREQIPALVRLHLVAFQGFPNTRLGPRYAQRMFEFFTTTPGGIAFCAASDDELVGYVIGAPVGYRTSMIRTLWPTVAIAVFTRPQLWLDQRVRSILWQTVRPKRQPMPANPVPATAAPLVLPPPIVSLVGIAVHPDARGQQVGEKLMAQFELEARRHNFCSLRLSVYPENTAARRLYERSGWYAISDAELAAKTPGTSMSYGKVLAASTAERSRS